MSCQGSTKALLFIVCWTSISPSPLLAQIVPDDTLGNESSVVTPDATIEGGAIRDNNLFHSFSEFNVGNGDAVYFANPEGIANILTRVTGNNISNIFGALGVNGTANLFLLNPNGIVFGENASLDINGSFLATTADSYIFDNGFEYNTSNPETPPLLTIDIPAGLQIGNNPGQIEIKDSGHSIFRQNDLDPFINLDDANGLRIKPEQTLSLIGGEINVTGGNLIAPDGRIELGSVAQGKVKLNTTEQGLSIDYTEIDQFQNINLDEKALIDVSGNSSGFIKLRGANIILKDSSVISSNHAGTNFPEESELNASHQILLEAEELIEITGVDPDSLTRTGIISNEFGRGEAAEIALKSNNLIITDGGFIGASSYSIGRGGNVRIEVADSVVVDGLSEVSSVLSSSIITANFADGEVGNLSLDTNRLEVLAGGNITSSVFGTGKGGDIVVNATESIIVEGIDENTISPSIVSSISFDRGNAGNLTINTAQLMIRDSGRVDSVSFASGNAGSLNLQASEFVEVTGISPSSLNPSFLTSAVVKSSVPILQQIFGLPDVPSGNAGSLTIDTPQLNVSNDGQVSVRNDGSGNAGSLEIDANSILLDRRGGITASTQSGNGGNVNLAVDNALILRDRSLISAGAEGAGDGGNINLNAEIVTLQDRSSIIGSAVAGNGGNINITTQGLFVSADSLVSASSEFGLDGSVAVETINSDRPIDLTKLPENPIDVAEQITAGCNAGSDFAIAGKGGLPENPIQNLRGQATWQDLRLPDFNLDTVSTQSLLIPQTDIKEAQSLIINQQGNIELIANFGQGDRFLLSLSNYQCS